MSYSFYAPDAELGDLKAVLEASAEAGVPEPQKTNAADAIAAAIDAVVALAPTITRSGDKLTVSISGHANEGCAPTPGWADCAVSISITQKPAAVEA